MTLKFINKKVELSNDEYFHIFGVIALSNNLLPKYKAKFGNIDKNKNSHVFKLTMDELTELNKLYDSIKAQEGLTKRVNAKLNMVHEQLRADVEWEKKTKNIQETYKKIIMKEYDIEMKKIKDISSTFFLILQIFRLYIKYTIT